MTEKLSKKWILRGLKLRGLRQNQISTPLIKYDNDRRNNIMGNFLNVTPTDLGVAHAIS